MRLRAPLPLASIVCALLCGCPSSKTGGTAAAPAPSGTAEPSPSTVHASAAPTTAPPSAPAPSATAPPPSTWARVTVEGHAMGTHLAFAAYPSATVDEARIRRAFDAAIGEIQRIEALMTTWRPDAEVARVNAAAGKTPVAVSQETFDVIKEALHTSAISDGAFDITFETLHGLWKFDEDLDPHPPSDAQIKERLPHVGWHHVHLDPQKRTVYLDDPQTKIGLGGIAKGYAVDRAAAVLRDAGLTAFFVQAGGDLYTAGRKPDGSEWQAGIRDPRGPEGSVFAMLPVSDHAFSTAGDYERSYVIDGKRYHHILDPKTGKPATASRSVTIWAPTAFLADAIDDAVFILGPKRGLALVDSLDGVGAVIVDAHDGVHVSKLLTDKIRIVAVPTDAP